MRKFFILALAGAALSAAPAFAETARWSDAEYLKASRCLGLAEAKELGAVDASGLATRIKGEGSGRFGYVRDRGDTVRQEARRGGATRSEALRAKLVAERDGSCKAYLGSEVAVAGAPS